MRLISTALDPRHAHRRQALRRHAQRQHWHFYQARLGWSLVRNFSRAPLYWKRERWVIVGVAALIALLALVVLPAGAQGLTAPALIGARIASVALPLPETASPTQAPRPAAPRSGLFEGVYTTSDDADRWRRVSVRAGQNLGDIFREQGFSAGVLEKVMLATRNTRALSHLKPGEQLAFLPDASGQLRSLQFDSDESTRVSLRVADDGGIYLQRIPRAIERRVRLAHGEIRDSLFAAADDAGIPNTVMLKLADIFGYDIDFAQDLREGDRFSIVYEELYRDGERLRDGDILAASFTNQGQAHSALRHLRPDGAVEFFAAEGLSLRKAFLRTPVEFTRISSGFSVARRHPVLGTMRAHRGVDYTAPIGTPVRAAGDGRVIAKGWQSGYGNAVQIEHGNKVTTLYGHLSRFAAGIARGARVRQGQVIGMVGRTGLATGPHLHYEFRVNGAHRDPLKVTMAPAQPLAGAELAAFKLRTQPLVAQLALMQNDTLRMAQR